MTAVFVLNSYDLKAKGYLAQRSQSTQRSTESKTKRFLVYPELKVFSAHSASSSEYANGRENVFVLV